MAKPKEKDQKLTPQQEAFCEEYIKDLNGTQAAMRAGYTKNEKAASVQASRLLVNDKVVQKIQELMDERSKRTAINADTILLELLKLATSDLRKLFDEDGKLLPPDQWPDEVAVAVASIEVDETFEYVDREKVWTGYTKKVKFWDKPKSLELLGKHLKLFTDKIEHSGKLTLEDLVAASRAPDAKEKG